MHWRSDRVLRKCKNTLGAVQAGHKVKGHQLQRPNRGQSDWGRYCSVDVSMRDSAWALLPRQSCEQSEWIKFWYVECRYFSLLLVELIVRYFRCRFSKKLQSNLAIRKGLIRNKLVLRNHFLWPICHLLHKDNELHEEFQYPNEFKRTNSICFSDWIALARHWGICIDWYFFFVTVAKIPKGNFLSMYLRTQPSFFCLAIKERTNF